MVPTSVDDPLTLALAPPPNETLDEKLLRLAAEAQARKVSDEIDEELRVERAAHKKRKLVKVLLLGQSESGKSTTLKNFQLTYAPKAWAQERASWRTVVHLNLVRSVNAILDILAIGLSGRNSPEPNTPDPDGSEDDTGSTSRPSEDTLSFNEKHRLLNLRLAPLRTLQRDLERRIGVNAGEEYSSHHESVEFALHQSKALHGSKSRNRQEFFVRSRGWAAELSCPDDFESHRLSRRAVNAQERDAIEIISGCAEDIQAIWEDPTVRAMLRRRGVMMETSAGFFLDDVARIAERDYQPSDDDIVRARLRTLGVQEYSIKFESGPANGTEWCLYDVGGSRTQRMAWYPYFDDCDAIIFLAPVSCFDEHLAEDHHVNRLEDSFALWTSVCSSKLLVNTQMILFLNKCDLLEKKLNQGVRVKDHVVSYGERPNDVESVTKYFSGHFKEILKRCSPEPRPYRAHMTSVVDTRATAITLNAVEEGILREYLKKLNLL